MKAIVALLVVVIVTSHKYNCVFDKNNVDLRAKSALGKPPQTIISPGVVSGRLLQGVIGPMRIHLEDSMFLSIVPGVNGASNTTTTNLQFVLRTMQVATAFLESRLQVTQLSLITSPPECVDFNTSVSNRTTGFSNSDLVIHVQYLTDPSKTYGATGKSCSYIPGTASVGTPDTTLQIGRPIVGRIIFNTYSLVDLESVLTNRIFQSIAATALHETLHILGFDSTLYSTYLNPNLGYPYASTVLQNSPLIHASRPATKMLITPYVTAWARNFFGCNTLPGMLLENEDVGNSHWQRVAMYDEVMTGTIFGASKGISGLTFALLKDMGWYVVDDTFSETTNYGYKLGCSFLYDSCYSSTTFSNHFCNSANQSGISYCMTNYLSKAFCGNQNSFMSDGCGMYGPYFHCIDEASVDPGYHAYEAFGINSRCVEGTILQSSFNPTSYTNYQSRCYPHICSSDRIVFTIGSYTLTCLASQTGVRKTLNALLGYLVCPNYDQFCAQKRKICKNWCSRNGFCTNGVCNCLPGYSGDDCSITICTVATYYDSITNTCPSSCTGSYYESVYAHTCLSCESPCLTCDILPTTCLSCVVNATNPLYLYSSKCTTSCPSGTFLSSGSCLPCDSSVNCATCTTSATFCLTCLNSLYLSQAGGGSCVASCGIKTDITHMVCLATCPTTMLSHPNNTCEMCANGTYYYSGICNPNCTATGTYPDDTTNACQPCDPSCQNCGGPYPENCTSCLSASSKPYLLLKMCWQICPKGFYQNLLTAKCQVCPVQLSCSACINNAGTVTCTACIYGTYFQTINSSCGTSCTNIQFKNTWNNSCSDCNPTCATCTGPSSRSCTSCLGTDYLISNSTGGYCVPSCPVGYNISGRTCQTCDSTCGACLAPSAAGQCYNCSTGYYLYNGYCRYICPTATFPNNITQSCQGCHSTCSYCFGSTANNCSSCASSLYLYNFTCSNSCPSGLSPNQWNVCWEFGDILSYFLLLATILLWT